MNAYYINVEDFKRDRCRSYLKIINVKGVDEVLSVLGNKELKAILLTDDKSYVKPCYLINPDIKFITII